MRKFKNLDCSVFKNEIGTLTPNAFEVLNHTLGEKYGRCRLYSYAISLVSKNFDIIADNRRKNNHSYKREWIIEHFNEVTKIYYEILEQRKKIDYKNKLKNIENDFQKIVNIILYNFTINSLT